jgi:proteasome lid subunit RPN8/RPN11
MFKIKRITPAYHPQSMLWQEDRLLVNETFNALNTHLPEKDAYSLYIIPEVWQAIGQHIAWGQKTNFNVVEQGGLLLGWVYHNEAEQNYVGWVQDSVAGTLAQGSAGYLRMDHTTWKHMIDEIDQKNTDLQVIGWYHTHPNSLGVFMSGTDLNTQRKMFAQPWHFAIVMNPHRQIWRAFRGTDAHECQGIVLENSASDLTKSNHLKT